MTWVAPVILALFVAGRCLVPMDETDLFYNLRLGELILATHTVPRTNLFSFVAGDTPDPNLAWLFQLVLALAHRAGGIPGTVVLKTAFVVGTFLVLHRVAVRRGAHPVVASVILALAAWAAEPRFVERPHLVTFLGLAILLLALERAEAGRPRLLVSLIPLGLVWANGNSCFFLAPAVLLLYALGAIVDDGGARAHAHAHGAPDGARGDPGALRVHARRAALVALALVPLLFATPSGARWFGYVVNHFRMPSLRPLQEYRLAEWPTDGPFLFLLLAVVVVTVFARRAQSGAARHLLPVLALAVLGSRRIRFVAEFALLAGPYVAARAMPLLHPWSRRLRGSDARKAGWVALAGLLALSVGPRLAAARQGAPVLALGIEEGLVPTEAIAWVDARDLRARMYNDLEVGSYLIWQGWPRHAVFQDPRINGYPEWLHAVLRRGDLARGEWQSLMDRTGVRSALITYPEVNPRAALFAPAQWALVYRGDDALVFARREPARQALIAAEEIPLTFTFDPEIGARAVPLTERPAGSPVPACEWNRRLAAQWAAAGATSRATEALEAALDAGPGCLSPGAEASARTLLRALGGASRAREAP